MDIPPSYYRPLRPNHHRRAKWHDYCNPASYLITLSKNPIIPPFSAIVGADCGDHVEAHVEVTPFGQAIGVSIRDFNERYPMVRFRSFVIMPDHVHVIVHVPQRIPRPLGFYMSKFMGSVSRSINQLPELRDRGCMDLSTLAGRQGFAGIGEGDDGIGEKIGGAEMIPAFEKGFNDRILYGKRTWSVWENYVADNPRRYWLMRNRSGYFERGRLILPSSGRVFPTFGNASLLNYPDREVVRFSRRFSDQEWKERVERVMSLAMNGGVVVSPFIHPKERELRDAVLEAGGRVIHVVEAPFAPREKPARREFELCAEGRALIVARSAVAGRDDVMTRDLAMQLNRMSEWLVATPGLAGLHHGRD